jgi:hypothetical protein
LRPADFAVMTTTVLLNVIAGLMNLMPARLHARLHDVLAIEILYRHDLHQVTIHATLTTSTPGALTALIWNTTLGGGKSTVIMRRTGRWWAAFCRQASSDLSATRRTPMARR